MPTRSGFTLIEVMVALVILTVVLLAVGGATGRYVHTVALTDRNWAAEQLVLDRIEAVRLHPDYGALDTLFAGQESGFPTLPDFVRTTDIARVGGPGQAVDFKRITVTVTGPGLLAPVARTVAVGAP